MTKENTAGEHPSEAELLKRSNEVKAEPKMRSAYELKRQLITLASSVSALSDQMSLLAEAPAVDEDHMLANWHDFRADKLEHIRVAHQETLHAWDAFLQGFKPPQVFEESEQPEDGGFAL